MLVVCWLAVVCVAPLARLLTRDWRPCEARRLLAQRLSLSVALYGKREEHLLPLAHCNSRLGIRNTAMSNDFYVRY